MCILKKIDDLQSGLESVKSYVCQLETRLEELRREHRILEADLFPITSLDQVEWIEGDIPYEMRHEICDLMVPKTLAMKRYVDAYYGAVSKADQRFM